MEGRHLLLLSLLLLLAGMTRPMRAARNNQALVGGLNNDYWPFAIDKESRICVDDCMDGRMLFFDYGGRLRHPPRPRHPNPVRLGS